MNLEDMSGLHFVLTKKNKKLVHLYFESKVNLMCWVNENPYNFSEKELLSIRQAKDSDLKSVYAGRKKIKVKRKKKDKYLDHHEY